MALQLLNTSIIYFHSGVQVLNLVDNRFADLPGIRIKNEIAHCVERQLKFLLLPELVEHIEGGPSAFYQQYRAEGSAADLAFPSLQLLPCQLRELAHAARERQSRAALSTRKYP